MNEVPGNLQAKKSDISDQSADQRGAANGTTVYYPFPTPIETESGAAKPIQEEDMTEVNSGTQIFPRKPKRDVK
jgi:hypothetical protein